MELAGFVCGCYSGNVGGDCFTEKYCNQMFFDSLTITRALIEQLATSVVLFAAAFRGVSPLCSRVNASKILYSGNVGENPPFD